MENQIKCSQIGCGKIIKKEFEYYWGKKICKKCAKKIMVKIGEEKKES